MISIAPVGIVMVSSVVMSPPFCLLLQRHILISCFGPRTRLQVLLQDLQIPVVYWAGPPVGILYISLGNGQVSPHHLKAGMAKLSLQRVDVAAIA
jgi:hypothetical protein